jgi:L-fuculose-phosphate aldolase
VDATLPELIVDVAGKLFARKLTDVSGGNISARDGDTILITPRFAGSRQHWKLGTEDIMSAEIASDDFLEHPRSSRESRIHLCVYRRFPDVTGIVHAHPFHVLPFCVAGRSIEMVLESTQKFGSVDLIQAAPAHSQALADNIVAGLCAKEDSIRTQAAAVIAPRHGLFVAGKDLLAAFDATERIDWNAWCILSQSLMPTDRIPYDFDGNA